MRKPGGTGDAMRGRVTLPCRSVRTMGTATELSAGVGQLERLPHLN